MIVKQCSVKYTLVLGICTQLEPTIIINLFACMLDVLNEQQRKNFIFVDEACSTTVLSLQSNAVHSFEMTSLTNTIVSHEIPTPLHKSTPTKVQGFL